MSAARSNPVVGPQQVARSPQMGIQISDSEHFFQQQKVTPLHMTKVIHFIRHGQAYHNVAQAADMANLPPGGTFDNEPGICPSLLDENFTDSRLTEKGWNQAQRIRKQLSYPGGGDYNDIELVVVSPLTRTLETACAAFGGPNGKAGDFENAHTNGNANRVVNGKGALDSPGSDSILMKPIPRTETGYRCTPGHQGLSLHGCPPMIALEQIRESHGLHTCDLRRSISEVQNEFPGVDFSYIESEDDIYWKPEGREDEAVIETRIKVAISWIMSRPERCIAVVSHAGLLRRMLRLVQNDSCADNDELNERFFRQTMFNGEVRSVVVTNQQTSLDHVLQYTCNTDTM